MYEAVQRCNTCGANLTLDDLRSPNCKYCHTVFPHHAQAAQHAAMAGQMMNQMMAQQAQVQDAWRASFGVGPPAGSPPVGPPGGPPPAPYAAPSPYGPPAPYGASPYGPGSPYADPARLSAVQMAQVGRTSRILTLVIVATVVGGLGLAAAIVALIFLTR